MSAANNLAKLARYTVGLLAGNLLTLDANGKLPVVDGSQLTNLPKTAIGEGQTWQVVSRAANTVYQNTTGRPIEVLTSVGASGGTYYVQMGPTPTLTSHQYFGMSNSTNIPVSFIVPAGWYYAVTGGTIGTWSELR